MQKTIDTIIGENQLLLLKTEKVYIFYIFFFIVYLDFLKVFDRVDRKFIFSSLQKFGYGDKLVHMINVKYTSIQSKIKINGLLSDPFTIM